MHRLAARSPTTRDPTLKELKQIAAFQKTPGFFSSFPLLKLAYTGIEPKLPQGRTAAEKRGRRFFVDAPPSGDLKTGLCAACHSGPMLNETNEFIPAPPLKRGGRFQSVFVSEFNDAANPVIDFVFKNADGTWTLISSPDPGRALITGDANDVFESLNAFKIPSLWGVARTAPYFHDNSAKSLEDLMRHYARFFALDLDPSIPPIILTEQDQKDMNRVHEAFAVSSRAILESSGEGRRRRTDQDIFVGSSAESMGISLTPSSTGRGS